MLLLLLQVFVSLSLFLCLFRYILYATLLIALLMCCVFFSIDSLFLGKLSYTQTFWIVVWVCEFFSLYREMWSQVTWSNESTACSTIDRDHHKLEKLCQPNWTLCAYCDVCMNVCVCVHAFCVCMFVMFHVYFVLEASKITEVKSSDHTSTQRISVFHIEIPIRRKYVYSFSVCRSVCTVCGVCASGIRHYCYLFFVYFT